MANYRVLVDSLDPATGTLTRADIRCETRAQAMSVMGTTWPLTQKITLQARSAGGTWTSLVESKRDARGQWRRRFV